jgi:hypothetical protein
LSPALQTSANKISMRTDVPPAPDAPLAGTIPFIGHKSPFLRRTLWATFATLGLVALNAAVYVGPAWSGWYLLTGLWGVVFFCLTPLILKQLFEGRHLQALLSGAAKFLWIGLLLAVCALRGDSLSRDAFAWALVAGISTPLAVAVLRGLGAMTMQASPRSQPPAPAHHSSQGSSR